MNCLCLYFITHKFMFEATWHVKSCTNLLHIINNTLYEAELKNIQLTSPQLCL